MGNGKPKSIKKNAMMNILRTVSGMMFSFFTFPYLTRVLGPDGIGKIDFAQSIVAYFILLASLGIPLYGIREIAKVRQDRQDLIATIRELLAINICTSMVSWALFLFLVINISKFQGERALFIVSSMAILVSTFGMEWLYQGLEEYSYITIRSIIMALFSIISIFIFVHNHGDYIIAAAINVFAILGLSILDLWNARHLIFSGASEFRPQRHFRSMITIYAVNLVISIYTNLDTAMLGFLSNSTSIGYYSVGLRVVRMALGIVTSISSVLLPRLSFYVSNNQISEFKDLIQKSFSNILLFCIPGMAGLMLFSKEIVSVLAGKQFISAAPCILIMAPILLLMGVSGITGTQILIPNGKEKLVLLGAVTTAGISIMMNLLLIPRLGYFGAATTTLISETVDLGLEVIFVVKYFPVQFPSRSMIKYLAAVMVMIVVILPIKTTHWADLLKLGFGVPIGSLCYFASVYLLKDDYLKELIRNCKKQLTAFNSSEG